MPTTIEYNHCEHCDDEDYCVMRHVVPCVVEECKKGKSPLRTIVRNEDGKKAKTTVHAPYVERPEPEREFIDCFNDEFIGCTELCWEPDADCWKSKRLHDEREAAEPIRTDGKVFVNVMIDGKNFKSLVDEKLLPQVNGVSKVNDPVNHPSHYTSHPSGVECITITEHYGFNIGNCIKYLWREGLKGNDIEDLEKARWYLDREIEKRKATANN